MFSGTPSFAVTCHPARSTNRTARAPGATATSDLLEVERHGLGVAGWEDETGRLAERGTDGAENIGGGGSLILQGKRSRAAFRPTSRDLVF